MGCDQDQEHRTCWCRVQETWRKTPDPSVQICVAAVFRLGTRSSGNGFSSMGGCLQINQTRKDETRPMLPRAVETLWSQSDTLSGWVIVTVVFRSENMAYLMTTTTSTPHSAPSGSFGNWRGRRPVREICRRVHSSCRHKWLNNVSHHSNSHCVPNIRLGDLAKLRWRSNFWRLAV